jgi:hypothetical protein
MTPRKIGAMYWLRLAGGLWAHAPQGANYCATPRVFRRGPCCCSLRCSISVSRMSVASSSGCQFFFSTLACWRRSAMSAGSGGCGGLDV